MMSKMYRNGFGIMLNRLLWSLGPNDRSVHEWKTDARYIQQARGVGEISQTNKIQCGHGMRIKPEKPYSVRLERLYSSNDLGAFLDILSITLSFFLGFVLLSVVVVLLRSWLCY